MLARLQTSACVNASSQTTLSELESQVIRANLANVTVNLRLSSSADSAARHHLSEPPQSVSSSALLGRSHDAGGLG